MDIQKGKGKDGADIVTLSKLEARFLVEAIMSALCDERPDGWGDSEMFRVLISD